VSPSSSAPGDAERTTRPEPASPRVSIGLPVYNEARFIDAALTSLRAQDFPDLEIVVCDNASGDETVAICERHAALDPRIRIDRAAANRGATANFVRALELARGGYFLWAAGHDLWSPNLVSRCVAALESRREASVAVPASCWIDAHDAPHPRTSATADTRGLAPAARLMTILWGNMHPIYGLQRTDWLRACELPNQVGGDLVLLSQLALRGEFVAVPDALWSRREFRTETSYADKLKRYASADARIASRRRGGLLALAPLPLALARVAWRAPLPAAERLLLLVAMFAALPLRFLVGRRTPSA
jgi:glycosyltransferase involved in cell wall biosynthesis